MKIGDLFIEPVFDGVMKAKPSNFKGTTDEMWAQHRQFLDENGMVELALGGFLVRDPGGRLTLIDAGMGPSSGVSPGGNQYVAGELLKNLAAQGVRPEDVSDVLFTHLHFDHVGWASQEGMKVFPNATYRCDARDWEHFLNNERVHTALAPVEDRLKTWDGSGPLLPGVDTMTAPGHTPGSTIIVLSSGTARGLLLGDVVHCPVELLDDEWAGLGDVDPELAKRTRNALAREIEGKDVPVAAAHFPGMVFGRLLGAQGKRSWLV
ncbi:MAG TPA: MBL fold metallo-hydrolase [Chloroflexota bacterium]|jgi:glyoxylase-like metal-dependent hydrolase (beta-lactamase superfamily II)|nr:MBL fold metallo-hydrolase [Chloroflexota bacterium]